MSPEAHIPEARPDTTQGTVLEVPMVLDHAIDVTPAPHASDAFLGNSMVNRSLPLWRKAAIAGTAFVAGFTAVGVTPKPAEANGFLLTGSATSSECIDDSEVYVLKREPAIAVVNTEAQLASVAQPQTRKTTVSEQELPQGIEIAILPDGSRLLAVIAEACKTPEPNVEEYTLEHLYDKGYEPIKKNIFINIVTRNAPIILEFTKNDPELNTVEKIIADYTRIADEVIDHPDPKDATSLLLSIKSHVELAHLFVNSNIEISDALMEMADAMRRFGQKYIQFGAGEDPEVIDRKMDNLIRKAG